MKTALILGASGQTGAYLSRILVRLGYTVVGTSRDWSESQTWRLDRLGILDEVVKVSISLRDPSSIWTLLEEVAPEEIYNLAGPSSVAASFREPTSSMSNIFDPVALFLETLKSQGSSARYVNAASTDCFGDHNGLLLSEDSAMKPISPYGIAKTATYWTTQSYRDAFGISASNAVLTNHESPLRGKDFVTQKIISGLREISEGQRTILPLGNTDVGRDWLWAEDVARALQMIGAAKTPSDYVVGSGDTNTLNDFTELACQKFDLDPRAVISHSDNLTRPREITTTRLDPSKILRELGWKCEVSFAELVSRLVEQKL